ncbi:MAG: thiamine pyrophosphate-dependent enzyme [Bacteroidota bacterium]
MKEIASKVTPVLSTKEEILHDYFTCCLSREVSVLIRKEVLTGKAKFGVSDDGKEVFQVAMAKAYKRGDFRADYYRGHTLLLALDLCTVEDLMAQLYADTDNDPFSGGRQMNNHHASPLVNKDGQWLKHTERYNLSSDVSTTGGQMARAVGLALASKKYREAGTSEDNLFSDKGNEVCFCIIGDSSTSEGAFWEAVNAACVQQIPLAITVADDGYGISVPKKYQTTKESISEALAGFETNGLDEGMDIYHVNGWDYGALCEAYEFGINQMRMTHRPALFHIDELTQPQGHSTSGSHERYKSKQRLSWEKAYDCNTQFRKWILNNGMATEEELLGVEKRAASKAKIGRDKAWKAYSKPLKEVERFIRTQYDTLAEQFSANPDFAALYKEAKSFYNPFRSDFVRSVRRVLVALRGVQHPTIQVLKNWLSEEQERAHQKYHTQLYSEGPDAALRVPVVAPAYAENAPLKNGFEILNTFFDKALQKYAHLYAFGEDVGQIGDVNQGFAGLQDKYGEERVFDTGIREWTIVGQAIGMAMRGLRPIAEIQYLDYLIYAFSPLSDDLATLRYRSNNQQIAPAIIRTRGHRLEGIWHSGSPMSVLLGGLRGIYVCVPRNMVQASGMYNTLLQSGDPGLVIECLNGYRLKERLPENLGTYTVPLGVPEVLSEGTDLTLVTYGSCVRIAQQAIAMLERDGISVELIDVQTLLPFDLEHRIVTSLKKTNRIVFLDEDLPGGGSAYMLQQVLVTQKGYRYLDSEPLTISAKDHRPPYGSDGDYFSKPNVEDIYESVYALMHETDPIKFPL